MHGGCRWQVRCDGEEELQTLCKSLPEVVNNDNTEVMTTVE
jgi:hypothetical protein